MKIRRSSASLGERKAKHSSAICTSGRNNNSTGLECASIHIPVRIDDQLDRGRGGGGGDILATGVVRRGTETSRKQSGRQQDALRAMGVACRSRQL